MVGARVSVRVTLRVMVGCLGYMLEKVWWLWLQFNVRGFGQMFRVRC